MLAGLGIFMLYKVKNMQTPIAFLFVYILLLTARLLYLDDPVRILWHQLQSGGLLLFIFFMISDPKTMPDHPSARWIFGSFVAIVAFSIQFNFYIQYAPILALTISAPLVLFLDKLFPYQKFNWRT